MKIKRFTAALLSAAMLSGLMLLSGCNTSNESQSEDNGKVKIVATLFPQYDFAREIAGDRADITLLLPSGMESHSYEPTPSDRVKISRCDLFIYTGDNMEAWVSGMISDLNNDDTVILDVSKGVTLSGGDEHDHEHEFEEHEDEEEHKDHAGHVHSVDPHIWTSPKNAVIMTESILDRLTAIDPDNAEYYKANAEAYIEKLNTLDAEIRDIVADGKRNKLYFGGRFAFHYFVEEYGLDYEAAYDSCSTESEPSARRIAEISDDIKSEGIPVIYYEELADPKVARSLSEELNIKMLLLHSCHNLSQADYEAGETYLSLMKKNAENLREGLN